MSRGSHDDRQTDGTETPLPRHHGPAEEMTAPAIIDKARAFAAYVGPLRLPLIALALVVVLYRPSPDMTPVYDGWGFVPTVLIPVLSPAIFMVLMLDALMVRVFMADASGGRRTQLRRILIMNLSLGALILLSWAPFFIGLRT